MTPYLSITNIMAPNYEILFQIYLFTESFLSFKILAKKIHDLHTELKTILNEQISFQIHEVIEMVKRAKSSVIYPENLNEENSKKGGVFYNDKEFNDEEDINLNEMEAVIHELKLLLKKKINLVKLKHENSKKPNEILEELISKHFKKYPSIKSKKNVNVSKSAQK